VGVCILVILAVLLFKFVFVSEERRIEMTLQEAVQAVREEDLSGCMEHIAGAEWDASQVSRQELEMVIQEGFDTFDNIRIIYDELRIELGTGKARVKIKVKVIARYDEQVMLLLGTLTEGREIDLGMVKEGKKWSISSVSGVDIPAEVLEEF
jgi:hypothetical protein